MSETRSLPTIWLALLIGSVLLNGVLLGVTLQRALSPEQAVPVHGEQVGSPGRFNPVAFLQALPEDERDRAQRRLHESRAELRDLMRQALRARVNAMELMQSDTASEEDILLALQEARVARNQVEAQGEAVVLEIIAGLGPEDRARALRAAYSRDFIPPRMRRRPPPGDGAPPPEF